MEFRSPIVQEPSSLRVLESWSPGVQGPHVQIMCKYFILKPDLHSNPKNLACPPKNWMFKTLKMQGLCEASHISMIKSLDRGTRTWKWTHIESQSHGVLGTWSPRVLESWRHEVQSWSPGVPETWGPAVLHSLESQTPGVLQSFTPGVLLYCSAG